MISFKDEIRELERIREKLEQYENSNVEYKIMMLADQLVTISNSLKDKYDKKYPGRLQKVNQDIYMDQFETENELEMQELETDNIEPITFDDFAEDSFEENTLELDKEEIKETIEKEKKEQLEEELIEIESESESEEVAESVKEIPAKENTQPLVHVFNNHSGDIFFDKIAERMNELTFLYKPMQKENYLEGDYLEKFGSQRDMELQKSNAMRIHNQFWKANTVEHGNIFGSVPLDLINESAASKLLSYGWRLANVVIYDVKVGLDLWELNDHCLREFDNYLIIKEKKDGYTLIFEYNI